VDGFAELLDEVFDLLIQSHLPYRFLELQTCVGRFQLHALGIPLNESRGTAAAGRS
jgi:hypothetical protein